MFFSFVFRCVLGLLFWATPNLGLTSKAPKRGEKKERDQKPVISIPSSNVCFSLSGITFDNHYAIFRPVDNGLRFDLEGHAEILFLEKPEEPTRENSVYAVGALHYFRSSCYCQECMSWYKIIITPPFSSLSHITALRVKSSYISLSIKKAK